MQHIEPDRRGVEVPVRTPRHRRPGEGVEGPAVAGAGLIPGGRHVVGRPVPPAVERVVDLGLAQTGPTGLPDDDVPRVGGVHGQAEVSLRAQVTGSPRPDVPGAVGRGELVRAAERGWSEGAGGAPGGPSRGSDRRLDDPRGQEVALGPVAGVGRGDGADGVVLPHLRRGLPGRDATQRDQRAEQDESGDPLPHSTYRRTRPQIGNRQVRPSSRRSRRCRDTPPGEGAAGPRSPRSGEASNNGRPVP